PGLEIAFGETLANQLRLSNAVSSTIAVFLRSCARLEVLRSLLEDVALRTDAIGRRDARRSRRLSAHCRGAERRRDHHENGDHSGAETKPPDPIDPACEIAS